MCPVDVSVIIPCYNSEPTILRALNSILIQTACPREIIIVDDCSNDHTKSIVLKFKSLARNICIIYIELEENLGPSGARNVGWERSSSTYVAFLDADDTWHPKKIEIQYRLMRDNPYIDVSGHSSSLYNEFCSKVCDYSFEYNILFLYHFLLKNRFSTPSVMLKKNMPFRFDAKKKYAEDYGLWIEMAAADCFIVIIPVVLCFLHKDRYGQAGLSSNLTKMWINEALIFFDLWTKKSISLADLCFFDLFSFFKFIKRLIVTCFRRVCV